MGEVKTITFQFNISFFASFRVTGSIIEYTSKLVLNCLQEMINNLLNLHTRNSIATNKSYQNFITDIVKLK